MTTTPTFVPTPGDVQHVKLLSIFHYVVGGILALFSCFPMIYMVMGGLFLSGRFPPANAHEPDMRLFGGIFGLVGLMGVLMAWTLAALTVYAGVCLARRQKHMYCLVIAAILCAFAPFGTVLGVFTIVVLSRPGVRALFSDPVPRAG